MSTLYIHNGIEFREATTEEVLSHPAIAARVSALENQANSGTFHIRHWLVGTHGDLRIKGRWFERAGFSRGAQVSAQVFEKRLIIEVVKEPPKIRPRLYRRTSPPIARA